MRLLCVMWEIPRSRAFIKSTDGHNFVYVIFHVSGQARHNSIISVMIHSVIEDSNMGVYGLHA
jgi:hypothetical protein